MRARSINEDIDDINFVDDIISQPFPDAPFIFNPEQIPSGVLSSNKSRN